jgi:hypothetical protein
VPWISIGYSKRSERWFPSQGAAADPDIHANRDLDEAEVQTGRPAGYGSWISAQRKHDATWSFTRPHPCMNA